MALAVTVLGILLAGGLRLAPAVLDSRSRTLTEARLTGVERALKAYYLAHGTLPCPAPAQGGDPSQAGDCSAASGRMAMGTVPWGTLGLPPDRVLDGWGRRLTYAVVAALVETPLPCAPPTADVLASFSGIMVLGATKTEGPPGGARAVAVLISAGANGAGAITRDGARRALALAADAQGRINPATLDNAPPDALAPGRPLTQPLHAAADPSVPGAAGFDDLVRPLALGATLESLGCLTP